MSLGNGCWYPLFSSFGGGGKAERLLRVGEVKGIGRKRTYSNDLKLSVGKTRMRYGNNLGTSNVSMGGL